MEKQQTKWKKGHVITLLVIVAGIIGIFSMINAANSKEAERIANDPVAQMNIRINKQFAEWDGSHNNLVLLVKSNMNDASSFEHVATQHWKFPGDSLKVVMQYRGKNAFGAKVLEQVTAITDLDGRILSIQKN